VGAEIFTNFWCFVHNCRYRYARKSFKGFKDADFGIVSKKILSQKNGPWVGAQGRPKVAKKRQYQSHLWRSPPENPKPKTKKIFFSISTRRHAESVEGLNSSLALAAGDS